MRSISGHADFATADDNEDRYPLETAILRRDVYIDNVLIEASQEAREIQRQLSRLCLAGDFLLKKWPTTLPCWKISNKGHAVEGLSFSLSLSLSLFLSPSWLLFECHSILELRWRPSCDHFSFVYRILLHITLTKLRSVLSVSPPVRSTWMVDPSDRLGKNSYTNYVASEIRVRWFLANAEAKL